MKAVLIAAMVLAAMCSGAQAQQKYPPYPDVWGRELPVPGRNISSAETAIYPAADGDMLAYESFLADASKTETFRVFRLAFFSGHVVPVPSAEIEKQERKWPGPTPRSRGLSLDFSDGYNLAVSILPPNLLGAWSGCLDIPFHYGIKNFKIDLQKTLVRVHPSEMDVKIDGTFCAPNKQPITFKTKVRFSYSASNQDYILSDGTFLTVLDDDFVVRFDRTLHSPFIDQRPDLFVVDLVQLEPIFIEAKQREKDEPGFNPLQFIHDRVADLVATMPKPTPH